MPSPGSRATGAHEVRRGSRASSTRCGAAPCVGCSGPCASTPRSPHRARAGRQPGRRYDRLARGAGGVREQRLAHLATVHHRATGRAHHLQVPTAHAEELAEAWSARQQRGHAVTRHPEPALRADPQACRLHARVAGAPQPCRSRGVRRPARGGGPCEDGAGCRPRRSGAGGRRRHDGGQAVRRGSSAVRGARPAAGPVLAWR